MDKVIRKLRKLNEPVPKPLRLPTKDEIIAIENVLGVNFHSDYVRFLLEASDVVYGVLEPATVYKDSGHTYIVNIAKNAWDIGVPKSLLPIAEDNGDFYCMNQAGEISFWSQDGSADESWNNLEDWINDVWIEEN